MKQCAGCERTDALVRVATRSGASGPGITLYACPLHLPEYPPLPGADEIALIESVTHARREEESRQRRGQGRRRGGAARS
ncbi:hypothetical protein [Streptomyces zingiberis]|uniref:Uncharacterized protein n=1 Tax=Streptomyces zingiberis TaxID=2053010 RepID=A0ABX1C170_9ACTN|nr:hypothetical protein [Streptomyces zingiberis]NJQ02501.1 hypothetical protein [Streptomyces zingiberis]